MLEKGRSFRVRGKAGAKSQGLEGCEVYWFRVRGLRVLGFIRVSGFQTKREG